MIKDLVNSRGLKMGMYDNLECDMDLPAEGLNDRLWQTKDTPTQALDRYKIDTSGHMWRQDFDLESEDDSNALASYRKVNKRWVQVFDFTGEIRFYDFADHEQWQRGGWIEFSAYFIGGKCVEIVLIEDSR